MSLARHRPQRSAPNIEYPDASGEFDHIEHPGVLRAIARLDQVLPLRIRQSRLSPPMREAHRRLLRVFLETGGPPRAAWVDGVDYGDAVETLVEHELVVTDEAGVITGAYPFTVEPREHRVETRYGAVRAMCSIDALAISPMYDIPVTIRSRCRVSGAAVTLRQHGETVETPSNSAPVFAAIDWAAGTRGASCSATLCTEMMYIVGVANRDRWHGADPAFRQTLALDQAAIFAAAIFRPLVR
ncbi:MAG: hypothetical protein DWQ08_13285 [Proteobacteria bacterium]|nr:MAG: hypothetical protein DWQ08_13285 [Pseudomonadota bacterium]